MLGVSERNLTNVTAGKFEVEKSEVEGLMRLLGYSNFVAIDPNLKGETGIDVVVEYDGGRFAFQVSDFHSDEGTDLARKGSGLRRQESKKTKDCQCRSNSRVGAANRRQSKEAVVEKGFPRNNFAYCGLDTGAIGSSFDVPLGSKSRSQ
jgi:hypothetical protein